MFVSATPSSGTSLAEHLDSFASRNGLLRPTPSAAFIPLLSKVAIRSADYPVTSTAPDFVFRYDPGSGAFERVARALGAVHLETADSIGASVTEVGAAFLVSDASDLDGRSLRRVVSRFKIGVGNLEIGRAIPIRLRFKEFSLRTAAALFSLTRGITDSWDVNILVPLVATSLDATGIRDAIVEQRVVPLERVAISEERTGVGDILLRTKYRLPQAVPVDVAALFTLRIPTGREDNYQGLGEVKLIPAVAVSRDLRGHNVHANLGVEVSTEDRARNRGRYGAGVAIQAGKHWSLLIDVLGSSAFEAERFSAGKFALRRTITSNGPLAVTIPVTVPRTDLVDASFGIKVKPFTSTSIFASALVPITDDGLRADVIPFGGVQVTF